MTLIVADDVVLLSASYCTLECISRRMVAASNAYSQKTNREVVVDVSSFVYCIQAYRSHSPSVMNDRVFDCCSLRKLMMSLNLQLNTDS